MIVQTLSAAPLKLCPNKMAFIFNLVLFNLGSYNEVSESFILNRHIFVVVSPLKEGGLLCSTGYLLIHLTGNDDLEHLSNTGITGMDHHMA